MDYEFFENLSRDEARGYLDRYMEVEAKKADDLVSALNEDGFDSSFSFEALPGILGWIGERVEVVQAEPAAHTPGWLRESMNEEHGGFREFAADTREWPLRASFILGQTFISEVSALEWSIGRGDRAEHNQPVITGFRTDADLPVLIVAENLYLGEHGSGIRARAGEILETWRSAV